MLTADSHELLGRERELELIGSFLDAAAINGEALVLSGEPGVGKTALLETGGAAASSAGWRVLRSAGAEFEADTPFSGLSQLLCGLQGELDRLSELHRAALLAALGFDERGTADRLVVSTAALQLLRAAAATRPVLVIVDDLQWIDRSTATVLGFVARRLVGNPIGFIGSMRTGSDTLFGHAGIAEYEVEPLDGEAAAELLNLRFPMLAPQVRRRVLAEAAGNPLALLELPRAMSDGQRTAAEPLPRLLPLDGRLQKLFAARIAGLPDRTLKALLLIALERDAALGVLSSSPTQLDVNDLVPAEQAGLVRIDEGARTLGFPHPLIPAAVVELSNSAQRREAHRRLSEALSDRPERRAWHLAEATVEPAEDVAELLERAADRILRHGDAVGAVAALIRAADLSQAGSARARRLAAAAQVGADVTGNLRSVPRLLGDARRADPGGSGSLQAAVAATHVLVNGEGDIDTAHRLLVGAIETHTADEEADHQALFEALYALMALSTLGGGRLDLWAPFHAEVARLRPNVPDVLELCEATFVDPAHAPPGALVRLDAAITALHDEVDSVRIIRIGFASMFVDRLGALRPALHRVVDDGREGGAVAAAIAALQQLCWDDIHTGRWADAERLADEALGLCESHGYLFRVWPFRNVNAVLAASLGDRETTRVLTDELVHWATPRGCVMVRHFAAHSRRSGRGNSKRRTSTRPRSARLARLPPMSRWRCGQPWIWSRLPCARDADRRPPRT
jgi:hypothetical protein